MAKQRDNGGRFGDWERERYGAPHPRGTDENWGERRGVDDRDVKNERARVLSHRGASSEEPPGTTRGPQRPMDSESYGEGGYRRGPYWGRGPKGYQPSDVRIRENVCEAIAEHGWVDASDVEVLVEDCEVVLRGTVASRADKRSLEDLAEGVAGVRDVRNELRISSPPRRA